jgi:hypothetical protein
MNYSNLEDAYGSGFQQRVQVTQQRRDVKEKPIEQTFGGLAQRAEESIKKNQGVVDSLANALPLDTDKKTENFTPSPPKHELQKPNAYTLRESFGIPPPAYASTDRDANEKLNRILRLIEQNRTGYETPTVHDMLLYVGTGIFFLFTFDTFVMLGRAMNRRP